MMNILMNDIYNNRKQELDEFYYKTQDNHYINKDSMIRTIIMDELGVISGEEGFTWISPNKDYKFVINRYDNQLWINNNFGKFIISIKIFNNIGIFITELRFTEIDAIIILDTIKVFIKEFYNDSNNYIIHINHNNSLLEQHRIVLSNIYCIPENNVNSNNINIRFIDFNIQQHSNLYQLPNEFINKISLRLTEDQLDELSFKLFFCALIDLDLDEYSGMINDIEEKLF